VAVRVCEEDYEFVLESKSKILAMVENVDDVVIKKDLSLKRGDCVIDTDAGSIDAGLSTQEEQVKAIFDALLASE
jgi:flagellar assembly protein FliH